MKDAGHRPGSRYNRAVLFLCAIVICALAWMILKILPSDAQPSLSDAKGLKKGDIVTFGAYEQDADSRDGAEALAWIVLDAEEGRALLLAVDVLEPVSFHDRFEEITWEDCSLRKWLNSAFLEETFSEQEKERILEVENENPGNPGMHSHGGGKTRDRIFLLSMEEASAYFRTQEERFVLGAADATKYALLNHLEVSPEDSAAPGKACWWTRTSGSDQYAAVFVDRDGTVYSAGAQISHETYCGLRPAVWVRI